MWPWSLNGQTAQSTVSWLTLLGPIECSICEDRFLELVWYEQCRFFTCYDCWARGAHDLGATASWMTQGTEFQQRLWNRSSNYAISLWCSCFADGGTVGGGTEDCIKTNVLFHDRSAASSGAGHRTSKSASEKSTSW